MSLAHSLMKMSSLVPFAIVELSTRNGWLSLVWVSCWGMVVMLLKVVGFFEYPQMTIRCLQIALAIVLGFLMNVDEPGAEFSTAVEISPAKYLHYLIKYTTIFMIMVGYINPTHPYTQTHPSPTYTQHEKLVLTPPHTQKWKKSNNYQIAQTHSSVFKI